MTNKKSNNGNDKLSLTIGLAIVLAAVFAESMNYEHNKVQHNDLFSIAIGLVGWFGMFLHSQRIIDNNLFKQFGVIGIAIISASVLKQSFTFRSQLPLFTSGLPLLFIVFFRLLTFLFFVGYPNISKTPTIVFASKFGTAQFKEDDQGYKPTLKERTFSLLLFLGFIAFAFCVMWLVKKAV